MDLPQAAGPAHGGVGHVVLQRAPDPLGGIVMRAVPGAVEQFQAGLLFQVRGDLAGMMDAVVVADHDDRRGAGERPERLVQQGDEVRCAAAAQPVHPGAGGHLDRAEHGDLTVRARGEDLRAHAAQRPAGLHVRQQVQVRLVLSQHHRPAGQADQPSHDPGHHVVMVRVAPGGQLRPLPARRQPDPPVQRPRADLRPPQAAADPRQVQGPGRSSSAAIRLVSRRPPSRGRPDRGRSARPGQSFAVEPADPPAHRGRMAVQQLRDLGRR